MTSNDLTARFVERRRLHEAPGLRVSCVDEPATGRVGTLKVVQLEAAADARALLRELSLLVGLRHPRVTDLLDFGRDARTIWLLRRFVDGPTLRECGASLDPAERRAVFVDLLGALRWLHARGIVHHDLKPENVLLERREGGVRAVLSDFGLAVPRTATGAESVRGTPPFLAPEVLLRLPADERLDLFSLAATLASVDVPEERLAPASIYRSFPRDPWLAATGGTLERFDAETAAWLRRMLETDPEDRPRAAATVLVALGEAEEEWSAAESRALLAPEIDEERLGALGTLRSWLAGEEEGRARRVAVDPDAPVDPLLDRLRLHAVSFGLEWVDEPPVVKAGEAALELDGGRSRRHAAVIDELARRGSDAVVVVDLRAPSPWEAAIVEPLIRSATECGGAPRVLVLEPVSGDGPVPDPRVLALTAEDLAMHLGRLEGGSGAAARDRLLVLSRSVLEVAGANPERITDVLAAELAAGRVHASRGGLDFSGVDPDGLAPPADVRTRLMAEDPDRLALAARLALVGGTLPSRHAHRLYEDEEWARLRSVAQGEVRVALDGTGTTVLKPPGVADQIVSVADRDCLAAAARRILETEEVHDALAPSRRALVHAAAGDIGAAVAAAEECEASAGVARKALERAVELAPLDHPERGRLVVALVRRLVECGAYEDAERWLESALEARPAPPSRVELLVHAGETALLRRRFDVAEETFRRARRVLVDHGAAAERFAGDVARGLAFARFFQGDATAASRVLERFVSPRVGRGEPAPAWVSVLRGTFLLRAGEMERARAAFDEGLERLRDGEGSDHLRAVARTNLATLHLRSGELDAAREALHEVLRLRRGRGRPHEEAIALNNLGLVEREAGVFDEAERCFDEAARLYARLGDPTGEASAAANRATISASRGDLIDAEERLRGAAETFRSRGAVVERRLTEARLAEVRLDAGLEPLEEASGEEQESGGGDRVAGERLLVRARREEALGHDDEALTHAEEALASLLRAGDRSGEVRARLTCARLCRRGGLSGPARRHLDACDRVATPRFDAARWLEEGLLVEAEGGRDEAFHTVLRARDRARSTGEAPVRALAAAHAARVVRPIDATRARLLARETETALGAIRMPPGGADVAVRVLGTELARVIAMTDPTETATPAGADDAVPLELFRTFVALNRRVHQEQDRDRLMRTLLEHAVHLTGARRGHLLLLSQGRVVQRESYGQDDDEPAEVSLGIVLDAVRQGRPLLTANASQDQRFSGRRSIEEYDLRSVLCAPFRAPLGQDGALYVDNPIREGIFTLRSIDLLEALAEQASAALARFATPARPSAVAGRSAGSSAAAPRDGGPARWVGESDALREVKDVVRRLAPSDVPVLVTGESGTGKELVARALHDEGGRHAGPFVAVNCSAVPETLLEAEFFGYVRGAFTGADHDHSGYFEQAEGGTLFLDEIGDMPSSVQAKLLRALQDGAVRPVGALETVQTDVRLVCATNQHLEDLVEKGAFRRDLFYRIRVGAVRMPPLRERLDDVPRLASEFLRRQNDAAEIAKEFDPETLTALAQHSWPGNVRELENEVARLFFMTDGEVILPEAFLAGLEERRTCAGSAVIDLKPMAEIEKDAIRLALQRTRGNRERAARLLGIPRATFYARLKRYGLQDTPS